MRIHKFLLQPMISFTCFSGALFATPDSAKLSEALGHMIGKNLQSLNVPIDMEAIAKGLQDEAAGVESPMTDEACVKSLLKLQEEKELEEAVAFLNANGKRDGIVCLEGGKLQFEILKSGKGEPVQPYNSPWLRLKVEGDPLDAKDEIIALDEAIPGLKRGIVGMREGEVRKLYIHPELAFGSKRPLEGSNTLLIVEVEILKADASSDTHAASNADCLPILRSLDDERPLAR